MYRKKTKGRRCRPRPFFKIRRPVRLALCIVTLLAAGLGVTLLLMNRRDTPAPSAVPSAASEAALPTVIPSETGTTKILPAPSASVAVLEDIEGYSTTAKLRIDAISLDLFIIGEVSEAALKVSPCLYAGPSSPEYPGNIVITGHNNRNKTHFGRLDELESGSAVLLSDKYGTEYRYEVYGMETIGPDEVAALEEYEGEYGLTLVTCADQGKNRLLVRCRRVE